MLETLFPRTVTSCDHERHTSSACFGSLLQEDLEVLAALPGAIGLAALVLVRAGLAEVVKDQAALLQRAHGGVARVCDQLG